MKWNKPLRAPLLSDPPACSLGRVAFCWCCCLGFLGQLVSSPTQPAGWGFSLHFGSGGWTHWKSDAWRLGWVFLPTWFVFHVWFDQEADSKCCILSNPKLRSVYLLKPLNSHLHWQWGAWPRPWDGCIPSEDDDADHPPKHLLGGRARGSPIERDPHIFHLAGATIWDRQQATPSRSVSQQIATLTAKGGWMWRGSSEEQFNTKRARTINLHTQKNYIYISIYVGKSAFLRISLARIYAVLCAGRRDVFVCVFVWERDTIQLRQRQCDYNETYAGLNSCKLKSQIPWLHLKTKE